MENYRKLYKAGKSGPDRDEKREIALRQQKRKREDTFLDRRKIQVVPSPVVRPAEATKSKTETRREQLLRWKAEKEKLVARQKAHKKPPFKVGVAHHAIDPQVELAAVRATVAKHTTAKKAAAETRSAAATTRRAKAPSAAAASLAALSSTSAAPAPNPNFSGRVTRSRTAAAAAAASKTIVEPKPKKAVPRSTAPSSSSSISKNPIKSVPSLIKVAADRPNSKPGGVVKRTPKVQREQSFAPKDHKFKAPVNLTLPRTPLTLKRKAAGAKEANWPHIPGVSRLSNSPSDLKKTTVDTSPQAKRRRSSRRTGGSVFVVTDMPEPSTSQEMKDVSDGGANSTAKQPRRSVNTKKLVKDVGGGGGNSTPGQPRRSVNTKKLVQDVGEGGGDSTPSQPRRSVNTKKQRQSLKGKENLPKKVAGDSEVDDFVVVGLPQPDLEATIVSTRRMSIHEPSPPVHVSPDKLSNGMVPAQFSPFVTSARGKDKYSLQKRRSSLIPIVPEIPPEELARSRQTEHFRNLLERESSRLSTLSLVWEERQAEAPPSVQDRILGPVGQARLLVKDKFQQFRRLVDKFEAGDSEGKITPDDLTGFWEMMLLTVENVDKRFKELEDLRENNWADTEVEAPVKKSTSVAPVASKHSKRPQVQSRLKDIIEEARKRRQELKQNKSSNVSKDVATFDGGFFKVESPKNLVAALKPKISSPAPVNKKTLPSTPRQFQRRSLLQHVLTNSAVRAQNSPAASALNRSLPVSPSAKVVVAQMRASELGKRMSMDSLNDSFSSLSSSPVLKPEPTKSILKSSRKSIRINTPRNRVAFEVLNTSTNSSPGSSSPLSSSPTVTPPNRTPLSMRIATPGSRKRASLIPRPIPTPKGDRPSLMPMRESLVPSKPLPGGDLIDFSSPKRGSTA